jgi:predicted transcriptional regulator
MVAQRKDRANLMLPADLRQLKGKITPEDLAWLVEWMLRRATKHILESKEVPVPDLTEEVESAFLRTLFDLVEDFTARQPLTDDSDYNVTRFDAVLVDARSRLAVALREEKARAKAPKKRMSKSERAWGRLLALRTGGAFPDLTEQQLKTIREFDSHQGPVADAAALINALGFRSVRIQDEAKARLKSAAITTPIDDTTILQFIVKHILDRGESIQQAVIDAWEQTVAKESAADFESAPLGGNPLDPVHDP